MLILESTISLMRKLKYDLEQEILALECSDERLFSNGNGNLSRYHDLTAQLKSVSSQLREIDGPAPRMSDRQINILNARKGVREMVQTLRYRRLNAPKEHWGIGDAEKRLCDQLVHYSILKAVQ